MENPHPLLIMVEIPQVEEFQELARVSQLVGAPQLLVEIQFLEGWILVGIQFLEGSMLALIQFPDSGNVIQVLVALIQFLEVRFQSPLVVSQLMESEMVVEHQFLVVIQFPVAWKEIQFLVVEIQILEFVGKIFGFGDLPICVGLAYACSAFSSGLHV